MPKSRKRKTKLKNKLKKKNDLKKEDKIQINDNDNIIGRVLSIFSIPEVLLQMILDYHTIPPFYMYCFGSISSLLFRKDNNSQFDFCHQQHTYEHHNDRTFYGTAYINSNPGRNKDGGDSLLARSRYGCLIINPIYGVKQNQYYKTKDGVRIRHKGMSSFDENGIYYSLGYDLNFNDDGKNILSLYKHDYKVGYSELISNDLLLLPLNINSHIDDQTLITMRGHVFIWCGKHFNRSYDLDKKFGK